MISRFDLGTVRQEQYDDINSNYEEDAIPKSGDWTSAKDRRNMTLDAAGAKVVPSGSRIPCTMIA